MILNTISKCPCQDILEVDAFEQEVIRSNHIDTYYNEITMWINEVLDYIDIVIHQFSKYYNDQYSVKSSIKDIGLSNEDIYKICENLRSKFNIIENIFKKIIKEYNAYHGKSAKLMYAYTSYISLIVNMIDNEEEKLANSIPSQISLSTIIGSDLTEDYYIIEKQLQRYNWIIKGLTY